MPELPEVETIVNDLRALVRRRRIVSVVVRDRELVRYPAVADFSAGLTGAMITTVDRRAKYLLFRLSTGQTLVVHLMLTGQLLLVDPETPVPRSTRLILGLDNNRQLRLVDARRFARAYLLSENELNERLHLDTLGPEAIAPDLTEERFAALIRRSGRLIKAALLDQRTISGLGNIYTDETLFAARIHPERRANSLTDEEVHRLYEAMRRILHEAIRLRGTTTGYYLDPFGRKGRFQERLKVFRRADEPCPGCPGQVERIQVAGRETFVCPRCQVQPRAA